MVSVMDDVQAVLQASCDEIEILFPLASIEMILSKQDAELTWVDHNQIEYQKNTYSLYSMAELLSHCHHDREDYILLIRDAGENFAVMMEAIHGVIRLNETSFHLPSYLPRQPYIISCHILDGKLAYLIDFKQLAKQQKNI